MFTLDKRGDWAAGVGRGGGKGDIRTGSLSCESGLNMWERVTAVRSFRGKKSPFNRRKISVRAAQHNSVIWDCTVS